MIGKIDYDAHNDIIESIDKYIKESLIQVMADDYSDDWIDLTRHFSSITNKASKEDISKEIAEMTGVF